jgi:hypothetical protein
LHHRTLDQMVVRFQKPQGGELYVDEDASEEDAFSKKIHRIEVAALVIAYLPKHHVTSLHASEVALSSVAA